MRNCNCAGATCGCAVTGAGGILVTGIGTANDPFVVTLGAIAVTDLIKVEDTPTVNMTILGSGTFADPYIISAAVV